MLQPISQSTYNATSVVKFKNTKDKDTEYNVFGAKAANSINNELDFQKKVIEQNERNILLLGILTLTALMGTFIFNLKAILDMTKKNNSHMTAVIRDFESLKNNDNIPTLNNCKSINKELRTILNRQVSYINAGDKVKKEVGNPVNHNRMLLYGTPGTGKSFFSKILAKTIDADYKEVMYSDFNSMWAGEDVDNLKKIFEDILKNAKKHTNKKFVVTFNEIDSLVIPADKIADKTHGTHWVSILEERSVFLNYLERLKEETPNVIIIGTTNISPKNNGLDRAAMSRFQHLIEVSSPDKDCLYEALKLKLTKIENSDEFVKINDKNLQNLAQKMAKRRFSFRNLDYIINEAQIQHLESKLHTSESNFKFEYLQEAVEKLKISDGEL